MCRLCPTLLCTLLEIEIRSQPAASLAARGFVAREACVAAQRTPRLLCRRGTEVSCVAALFSSLARRHLACLLVPRSPPPHLCSRPSLAATSPVFSSLDRRHLTCVLVPRSPSPRPSSPTGLARSRRDALRRGLPPAPLCLRRGPARGHRRGCRRQPVPPRDLPLIQYSGLAAASRYGPETRRRRVAPQQGADRSPRGAT